MLHIYAERAASILPGRDICMASRNEAEVSLTSNYFSFLARFRDWKCRVYLSYNLFFLFCAEWSQYVFFVFANIIKVLFKKQCFSNINFQGGVQGVDYENANDKEKKSIPKMKLVEKNTETNLM